MRTTVSSERNRDLPASYPFEPTSTIKSLFKESGTMSKLINCPGCGASVPDLPGLPHKYIGATMGCWEIYTQILAKEYGEFRYPEHTHRMTVDTYAVQHPGQPGRQSIQSVNGHLLSLHFLIDRGMTGKEATAAFSRVLRNADSLTWLTPPVPNGTLTVLDVVIAPTLDEHTKLVESWANNVWEAWSPHHATIRKLADQFMR